MPVGEVIWQETTVDGAPALQLEDQQASGLLWQADGRIHGVGGEGFDLDVLRAVADGIS